MAMSNQEGVPDGMKRCSKCGEVKVVGEFYGREARCKDCKNEETRKRYAENIEKNRNRSKIYHDMNIEKIKQRSSEYYIKNKTAIIARQKEYYFKNSEKIATRRREYRHRTIMVCREKSKVYYIKNRDKLLLQCREYRKKEEYKTFEHIRYINGKTGSAIRVRDLDDATFQAIHATYMIERELKNLNKVAKSAKKPLDNPVHSADNSSNSIGGN